jgi:hypothetical protein
MITIQPVNLDDRAQVKQFVAFPHRLYANCPQWVPPLNVDAYTQLDPQKHPFYEHSDAAFWLALKDGRIVGRIAALENKPYNAYHNTKTAAFYFFDSENDPQIAAGLFGAAEDWARVRGLNRVIGPKGLGPLDGYGVLVFGFEHRQTMTMLNYNFDYYPALIEGVGYEKEVDFVSCYLPADQFKIPERVERIANKALARGGLQVKRFANKKDLLAWAARIGKAYNEAFVQNWEYYPLTQREIDFVVENIMTIADHRLIKIITHGELVVGFLFAFPDVSAALQRARGNLNPISLLDLLIDMKRTSAVSVNGMGILPQFQGHGGNAILYLEMGKTLLEFGQFAHVEMTQVSETAEQMRADLKNLNGIEYKNHRVYGKDL